MMNDQFKRLWRLAKREGEKLNEEPSNVFSSLGLYLIKPEFKSQGYPRTPTNALTFGATGVDGEHFSFLSRDGQIIKLSPVIMTVPMASKGNCNLIVGKDLFDFLSLGYQVHFASIPALVYSEKDRKAFITSVVNRIPIWEGSPQDDEYTINQKYLSGVLGATFGLHPWENIEAKLEKLSEQFWNLVKIQ